MKMNDSSILFNPKNQENRIKGLSTIKKKRKDEDNKFNSFLSSDDESFFNDESEIKLEDKYNKELKEKKIFDKEENNDVESNRVSKNDKISISKEKNSIKKINDNKYNKRLKKKNLNDIEVIKEDNEEKEFGSEIKNNNSDTNNLLLDKNYRNEINNVRINKNNFDEINQENLKNIKHEKELHNDDINNNDNDNDNINIQKDKVSKNKKLKKSKNKLIEEDNNILLPYNNINKEKIDDKREKTYKENLDLNRKKNVIFKDNNYVENPVYDDNYNFSHEELSVESKLINANVKDKLQKKDNKDKKKNDQKINDSDNSEVKYTVQVEKSRKFNENEKDEKDEKKEKEEKEKKKVQEFLNQDNKKNVDIYDSSSEKNSNSSLVKESESTNDKRRYPKKLNRQKKFKTENEFIKFAFKSLDYVIPIEKKIKHEENPTFGLHGRYSRRMRIPRLNGLAGEKITYRAAPDNNGYEAVSIFSAKNSINELFGDIEIGKPKKLKRRLVKKALKNKLEENESEKEELNEGNEDKKKKDIEKVYSEDKKDSDEKEEILNKEKNNKNIKNIKHNKNNEIEDKRQKEDEKEYIKKDKNNLEEEIKKYKVSWKIDKIEDDDNIDQILIVSPSSCKPFAKTTDKIIQCIIMESAGNNSIQIGDNVLLKNLLKGQTFIIPPRSRYGILNKPDKNLIIGVKFP